MYKIVVTATAKRSSGGSKANADGVDVPMAMPKISPKTPLVKEL
jgi:hypothetical protein